MSAEHPQLEWKAAWRDEYLKRVCAFSNADGGTLVIGRDDEGRAVGEPGARNLLEVVSNKVRELLCALAQLTDPVNEPVTESVTGQVRRLPRRRAGLK